MYGYLDESGAPGVATQPNDFFVVSLVLFPDKESANKCSASIDRLRKRLNIPDNYEFHFSRNSSRPKTALIKLLPNLDFHFITIAIRKTDSYKFASSDYIAKLLLKEISEHVPSVFCEMDSNPTLLARLKRRAKEQKLENMKFKSIKSHNHNLIQLADYVAGICSKEAKKTAKSAEFYRAIAKKEIVYTRISDKTKKAS